MERGPLVFKEGLKTSFYKAQHDLGCAFDLVEAMMEKIMSSALKFLL